MLILRRCQVEKLEGNFEEAKQMTMTYDRQLTVTLVHPRRSSNLHIWCQSGLYIAAFRLHVFKNFSLARKTFYF